jgi:transglutaminase-like putative cysteine protease
MAIATAAAGSVSDPWRCAVVLEQYLYRMLGKVDFSQIFSSAAEVAARRTGDCSEHAVLLAATCRARKIPARVAIGLLYSPENQRFLYHMWNEVWIKDRWIPLDATLGRGGIGATHLKLRTSSLAGESPYSLVTPVVHLIDKLKIEVVEVR